MDQRKVNGKIEATLFDDGNCEVKFTGVIDHPGVLSAISKIRFEFQTVYIADLARKENEAVAKRVAAEAKLKAEEDAKLKAAEAAVEVLKAKTEVKTTKVGESK